MARPLLPDAKFDLAVIGAGPAGLVCGLAASQLGLRAAVVGPQAVGEDGRTAALFEPSINLLKNLGVWTALSGHIEPLRAIRIVDATGSLVRAPEVTFEARDIGLDAFGYNIPNAALTAALEKAAGGQVHRADALARDIEIEGDSVTVTTADGAEILATLAAAADGRASPTRAAAGIATSEWRYDQAAVVATLSHARPHNAVSTEFHRRAGPLTLVPGPGLTSSLVWVEAPDEARRLGALADADFTAALQALVGSLLGDLFDVSPRRVFPLSGLIANPLAKNRVALIGEAAHVMPPIGAQGLNLSMRDAATLATLAAEAKSAGRDPGSDDVLARYISLREPDVRPRILGVDLMNRSLLSHAAPVHLSRGLGLFALATIAPLRRLIMREGMAPPINLPELMRPGAAVVESHPLLNASP